MRERVRWKRHKVKNGEAISQIAQQYGTTVSALRAANNLRGNTIRAGQHLLIPVATKPLSAYVGQDLPEDTPHGDVSTVPRRQMLERAAADIGRLRAENPDAYIVGEIQRLDSCQISPTM